MKILKKILIVVAYVIVFAAVFVGSTLLSFVNTIKLQYKPLKVDWTEDTGTIYKDLDYKNEDGNKFDLYIPKGPDSSKNQSVILYIHGGGFTSGSKSEGETWCKFLATHGYITASVDYTVQNEEHSSNLNLMNAQIKSCVDSIYKECEKRGYHVTGMATTGPSAGGCLALLYAYSHSEDSAIPVRFVFEMTGPVTFEPENWGAKDNQSKAEFVAGMTGKEITPEMVGTEEYQAEIDAISPAALVNEKTVPTLCAYGPKDHLVPPQFKFELFKALEQYHVPYEYIEYPNSNHGMYSDMDKHEEFINKALSYCRKYFDTEQK